MEGKVLCVQEEWATCAVAKQMFYLEKKWHDGQMILEDAGLDMAQFESRYEKSTSLHFSEACQK